MILGILGIMDKGNLLVDKKSRNRSVDLITTQCHKQNSEELTDNFEVAFRNGLSESVPGLARVRSLIVQLHPSDLQNIQPSILQHFVFVPIT